MMTLARATRFLRAMKVAGVVYAAVLVSWALYSLAGHVGMTVPGLDAKSHNAVIEGAGLAAIFVGSGLWYTLRQDEHRLADSLPHKTVCGFKLRFFPQLCEPGESHLSGTQRRINCSVAGFGANGEGLPFADEFVRFPRQHGEHGEIQCGQALHGEYIERADGDAVLFAVAAVAIDDGMSMPAPVGTGWEGVS